MLVEKAPILPLIPWRGTPNVALEVTVLLDYMYLSIGHTSGDADMDPSNRRRRRSFVPRFLDPPFVAYVALLWYLYVSNH